MSKRRSARAPIAPRVAQRPDETVQLTALQVQALRKSTECLLDGDLEGARGYLNHVALYPALQRDDDLSAFVRNLSAFTEKLIKTFRSCA